MYIDNNKTIKNKKLGVNISISVSRVPNCTNQIDTLSFLFDERIISACKVEFVDSLEFVKL